MYNQDDPLFTLFHGLSAEQLDQLFSVLEARHFFSGEEIFHQGKPASHFYILQFGEVEIVYHPADGPALSVSVIQPGGVFGWSAALGRKFYTSGAVAVVESMAYRMSNQQLQTLNSSHPDTAKLLLQRMASQVAQRMNNIEDQVLSILNDGIEEPED